MDEQERADREAIRDLLARYTYAGDRGRLTELAGCFAENGILEFPGNSGTGPDGVIVAL
jgi:SnoaL-like domain